MDPLLGIAANTPWISIGANGAIASTSDILATELNLLSPGLFGGGSTIVQISGQGQLLSAVASFQDQLRALQPGSATSGGGQNFGTDVASLAAEAQSLVDTFNSLQSNVVNISGATSLEGGSILGASGLIESLNSQVQANFSNGASNLSNLSQLGIEFKLNPFTGGGSLSLDMATLKSAFDNDATGAFSLLTKAANSLGNVGGNFVANAGSQFSALGALSQVSSSNGYLSGIMTGSLLARSGSGTNMPQVLLALNQYALISALFA